MKFSFEKALKNVLDLQVLALILDDQKCGYDIIEEIYKMHHVLLSPGTIYPLLQNMENEGLVERHCSTDRRKTYQITPAGRGLVTNLLHDYERILSKLKSQRFCPDKSSRVETPTVS